MDDMKERIARGKKQADDIKEKGKTKVDGKTGGYGIAGLAGYRGSKKPEVDGNTEGRSNKDNPINQNELKKIKEKDNLKRTNSNKKPQIKSKTNKKPPWEK